MMDYYYYYIANPVVFVSKNLLFLGGMLSDVINSYPFLVKANSIILKNLC